MANNKIIFGNTPLIDLTSDTATPNTVLKDTIFLGSDGTTKTGTFEQTGGGVEVHSVNLSIPGKTYTVPTWSTGTVEDIQTILERHYAGQLDLSDFWEVGDKRTIQLSAMSATGVGETHAQQNVDYVLSNIGGKYLADGITECAFQVDQVKSLSEGGYLNSELTNVGGWKESARRTWCNSVYKNAIPSTIRDIFKEFINQTSVGNAQTTIENTVDTFALRAEIEIFGSITYSVNGEGSQVEWYKNVSNRNKGSHSAWWERSPTNGTTNSYCVVLQAGTAYSYYAYNHWVGITPFTVI